MNPVARDRARSARDLADDLDRDLALARDRARALDRALDRDFTRALIDALTRTLAHARDLIDALDLARDRNHALTRYLARDLAHALDRDLDRARGHARARGLDRNHAHALDLDLAHAGALVGDLARALEHDFDRGGDSVESLPQVSREDGWQVPSRPARGVVTAALRVLPAGSRARYTEEVRDELGMLGWWAQLRYAAGFAARSWELRRSLRDAGPAPAREL